MTTETAYIQYRSRLRERRGAPKICFEIASIEYQSRDDIVMTVIKRRTDPGRLMALHYDRANGSVWYVWEGADLTNKDHPDGWLDNRVPVGLDAEIATAA